jgi:hypothetical protein
LTKLLLFIAVALGIFVAFGYVRRNARLRREQAERAATPAEGMVSCSLCGLNVPRSEAVQQAGRYFCCDDHRQRNASGT